MPRVSQIRLPPIDWGQETIGQRLGRIRQERGFTRVELAGKIGILQTLVADYENGRLRLTAEMAVCCALALGVSLDELLHPNAAGRKPSRKIPLWLEQIEALPRTTDTFFEVAVLKTARHAVSADMPLFGKDERGPGDDLKLQFEAARRFPAADSGGSR